MYLCVVLPLQYGFSAGYRLLMYLWTTIDYIQYNSCGDREYDNNKTCNSLHFFPPYHRNVPTIYDDSRNKTHQYMNNIRPIPSDYATTCTIKLTE